MYSVWIAFGAFRLSHKTAKNREKPYKTVNNSLLCQAGDPKTVKNRINRKKPYKRYKAFTVYSVYTVFYGFSRFWVCLGPDPSLWATKPQKTVKNRKKPYKTVNNSLLCQAGDPKTVKNRINRKKPYKRYKAFTVYSVYTVFYGFGSAWVRILASGPQNRKKP